MNRIPVSKLTKGNNIESTYMVSRANLRPYSRGQMLSLKFADDTGEVDAVAWDNAENLAKVAKVGKVVKVFGAVGEYKGERQITVQNISAVEMSAEEMKSFLPSGDRDIAEMKAEIEAVRDTLKSDAVRSLWSKLLDDEDTWKRFTLAPGGKKWHHAYLGGLLEHTCSVLEIANFLAKKYPGVDRDLLLTGALFHDVGKVRELTYETVFGYSDEGRLVGHNVLGSEMLAAYAADIDGFPEDRLLLLKHMILSHHDDRGGSPIVAMTKEALLLHFSDLLDSQFTAVCREMEEASANGEEWSNYVRLLERYLYAGSDVPWSAEE